MIKAWDVKDLVNRYQSAGLPILEEGAVKVINSTLGWVEDSVRLSDSKLDDVILIALPLIKEFALKMADKISSGDVDVEGSLTGEKPGLPGDAINKLPGA